MDWARFLEELPELFDDYPSSEHPRDRRFRSVAEDVENLARENNLALINLAASCLGEGEAYVEIGVYHGASLIAAMLGNEGKRFIGVDGFGFRDASLEKVEGNLARYGLGAPEIVVEQCVELLKERFGATVEWRAIRAEEVYFPLPKEFRQIAARA